VNKYLGHLIIFILFISLNIQAQVVIDSTRLQTDTLKNQAKLVLQSQGVKKFTSKSPSNFKPDPLKVVWMGAIIPGYGQILNKKYWKLPLVYGGFLGFAYAISMNSSRYSTYTTAYKDINDADPTTNSYILIIPKGYTIDNYGGISGYTKILKSAQDNYRRYRDLSIIMSIGYYAITLVDAYVDAQLYNFDISPDLSLRFEPTLIDKTYGMSNSFGIQCRLSIK